MRKLTRKQKSIISKLHKLSDIWDKSLQLFADNGRLIVVDRETAEVLDMFENIICDGGDLDKHYDEDGNEYLDLSLSRGR